MNLKAECWAQFSMCVLAVQFGFQIWMLVSGDIEMTKSYPIYFVFDLLFFLPQIFVCCIFQCYKTGETETTRGLVPVGACVMIAMTAVLFFESFFMLVKNQQQSVILSGQGEIKKLQNQSFGKDGSGSRGKPKEPEV